MSRTATMKTAAELSALPCADFVSTIGGVYEKSPWIAEMAHAAGPYDSLAALAAGLKKIVQDAGTKAQTELLQAHPDLAGKAALAGELTAESTEEQALAGLGSLTPEEMATFVANNDAYKAKRGSFSSGCADGERWGLVRIRWVPLERSRRDASLVRRRPSGACRRMSVRKKQRPALGPSSASHSSLRCATRAKAPSSAPSRRGSRARIFSQASRSTPMANAKIRRRSGGSQQRTSSRSSRCLPPDPS